MTQELYDKIEKVWKKLEQIGRFGTRYQTHPYKEAARIGEELLKISDSIPSITLPITKEELLRLELKRRLNGEAIKLQHSLSGKPLGYDTTVAMYGINPEDLQGLRDWLVTHRDETQEAIERLFRTTTIESYELGLQMDIPRVRRQAEEFADVCIQNYHKKLGRLLQNRTKVGEFLREVTAVATTEGRSYFFPLMTMLAIGIPGICYSSEDGSVHLRERELIRIYGHEGMGHALNTIITRRSSLPYLLRQSTPLTVATEESLAQFSQRQIFDDVKESPETQKALSLEFRFDDIYQEAKDIQMLEDYKTRFFWYAITVLADTSLGDPKDPRVMQRKKDLLAELTLEPSIPHNFIEEHKNSFDSNGNLDDGLLSELRYAARPVQRALEEFASHGITYDGAGRSLIDETMRTGFWTPQGFVDNARITAERGVR